LHAFGLLDRLEVGGASCDHGGSQGAHMKLSARNSLPGIVREIELGAVNAEVTIELAPELHVVSVITLDAVKSLNLKVGDRAYAVIKASSVMVAVD
jgi:molybdopterin-binding protein